ncbi:MAG: ketoacyl-ACP synthase III [Rickettsiaceae bacterium]|nr:ketoacyl-ACP synthase III [Rickettsiaceae bacterium]
MASRIIGYGGYLPDKILTNHELETTLDTTNDWITSRSGIKQRFIAATNELTSDLAYKASIKAIKNAGISKSEIDLIIVCTTTPDNSFPSVACKLQGKLDLGEIPAFDIQAVCSGFIYGLDVVNNMLKGSAYKTILLVCADKMSSLVDWQDRTTAILFGDGAGAMILRNDDTISGIIDTAIYSDGTLAHLLYTNGGVGSTGTTGFVKMEGKSIFKLAIEKMIESSIKLLNRNNMSVSAIDYLVPHQANIRIIDNIASKIKLPKERVIVTIDQHANCSAASIPLAFNLAMEKGLFQKGNIILFTAFGAGLTWGSAIYRY